MQNQSTTMSKSQEYFNQYPFELSEFQKNAIEGIVNGNNVLITAHTGSGKTLPAEFAIEHFVAQGKRLYILHLLKHFLIKNFMNSLKNFQISLSEFLQEILSLILKRMY